MALCKQTRRVSCTCRCKSVFQKYRDISNNPSLNEIDNLICNSQHMNYSNKCEYFESHGVDFDAVESHFVTVKQLDDLYNEKSSRSKKKETMFWLFILKLIQFYFSAVFNRN